MSDKVLSAPLKTLRTSALELKFFTKSKFLSFEESRLIFGSRLYILMLELERQAEKERNLSGGVIFSTKVPCN